ncbi:hypothetical protein FRC12_022570 [Ceratobasidium sp. 428]|nr:hypothetical protein FRC12_022570 [Ceratobasidium sp. 428]
MAQRTYDRSHLAGLKIVVSWITRGEKQRKLMTKHQDCDGYDDNEFTPGTQGMKSAILTKYDEDINQSKQTSNRVHLTYAARGCCHLATDPARMATRPPHAVT